MPGGDTVGTCVGAQSRDYVKLTSFGARAAIGCIGRVLSQTLVMAHVFDNWRDVGSHPNQLTKETRLARTYPYHGTAVNSTR